MSMMQLVWGAALGFLIAEGVLYVLRRAVGWAGHAAGWVGRGDLRRRLAALIPSPGSAIVGVLIRYAGVVAASLAVLTLGVWGVDDYLKAKHARSAETANAFDFAAPAAAPASSGGALAALPPAPASEPEPASVATAPDPYADAEFKVRHRPHRAGASASLTDTLLERSEAKARAELMRETREHERRSQYDCEAAERAARYLKAGLDVWGFSAWQLKYFPTTSYRGAQLPQCRDIKNVLDPASLDLRASVAQRSHS
jgi:hypothetical protein